nr:peptidylprolyl isomerase [Candidatus Sigynarchaeota archaeon]
MGKNHPNLGGDAAGSKSGGKEGKGGKEFSQKIKLSQIVVQSYKQAGDVIKEIQKGAKFEDVAKKVSIDSTKAAGGLVGSVEKKDVPEEIWEAMNRLRVNEISDPIKSKKGFYVIKRSV